MIGMDSSEYVAASQLVITNSTGFMYNFCTIWNSIHTSFIYNSVTQSIETVNCSQDLDLVDFKFLLQLINNKFHDAD